MSKEILIVDDERDIRTLIRGILEDEGYTMREAENAKQAFAAVEEDTPDLVILDIWLQGSDKDGMEILKSLKADNPFLPVLMISGHGTIETAVKAIKDGAYDFIEKPFKSDRLILMIQRALENAALLKENASLKARTLVGDTFLGNSQAAQNIRHIIERAAPTGSRILITGPAGTGKNVIARALHKQSKRAESPFTVVNCSAIAPDRFEDELFGSTRDTSSCAMENAQGGTLFLDEIADMPLDIQKRFVHVLQDQKYKPMDGGQDIDVDIRIIASTNKDLEAEIKNGNFREDLYYRLNVVPIYTPPLKDRPQDIPALADYFIEQCAAQSDLKPCTLSEKTKATLQSFEWPGNARQLRNVMEWVLIMNGAKSGRTIEPDDLPGSLQDNPSGDSFSRKPANDYIGLCLKEAREEFERNYLLSQINRFGGNISQTAKFVGMERSALHRKMKSLDISAPDKQDEENAESHHSQKA